jgi:formate dehydrogenase major subunit
MVRDDSGVLVEVSWDEALDRAADGFKKVVEEHGPAAIYAIASGRAPNEAAYAVQKLMRAGWGLNHVDHCARA